MTEQTITSNPSQNDKIMATLAHISAILPFMGVIAPIIIWITQKEKSEFVAFQALQAIAYQLTMIFTWFMGMGCYMLSFFSMFLTMPLAGGRDSKVDPSTGPIFMVGFLLPFIIMGGMFLGQGLFLIYGLIGAIQTFRGRDFRYVILGNRLAKYLQEKK